MSFVGIPAALQSALASRGYGAPTPVQSAVLAEGAAGRDLLVSAQTGSGKTVAFGLSIAPELLKGAERLPPPGAPLFSKMRQSASAKNPSALSLSVVMLRPPCLCHSP
jgi:ATP-dependent RNA helicase DeaD